MQQQKTLKLQTDSKGSHCYFHSNRLIGNKSAFNKELVTAAVKHEFGLPGNLLWPSVNASAFVWFQPHQQTDAPIRLVISVTQESTQKIPEAPYVRVNNVVIRVLWIDGAENNSRHVCKNAPEMIENTEIWDPQHEDSVDIQCLHPTVPVLS